MLASRSSCWTSRRPTSSRWPAEPVEVLLGLERTMLMVTHDLPSALQLCGRAVVVDDGVVVGDGPTRAILADAGVLAAHRLEPPFGFAV